MSEPQHPPFPEVKVDWHDLAFGIVSGYQQGYRDGHEAGHRLGWDAGLARAKANDADFIRGVADELRRRELEDEQMDTSDVRRWIKKLIESIEAKAKRDEWDARVRRERANTESRSNAA